jgi:hypothetical protein
LGKITDLERRLDEQNMERKKEQIHTLNCLHRSRALQSRLDVAAEVLDWPATVGSCAINDLGCAVENLNRATEQISSLTSMLRDAVDIRNEMASCMVAIVKGESSD